MSKKINKVLRFLGWSFILMTSFIFLFEVTYRVLPKSFFGTDYGDLYSNTGLNEGGFLKPNVNRLVINGYGEKVKWITNSKGFRNSKEITKKKPKNTFRILSLGDSFTAGARIGQSKTYSFLLEEKLNSNQDSIDYEVIIANIEDPVQGLLYLNRYGIDYEPDLILLGITLGNDITQAYIELHQNGRFQIENNKLSKNPNYSQKPLRTSLEEKIPTLACSYDYELDDLIEKMISIKLLKSFFNIKSEGESIFANSGKSHPLLHDLSHGLGMFLKSPPKSIETSFQNFEEVLLAYQSIAKTRLIICLFPQRYQVNNADWKQTIKDYDLNQNYFDLSIANKKINAFCTKNNIELIDPTLLMNQEYGKNKENFYFPMGDMHWNNKGNQFISKSISNYLKSNNNSISLSQ